MCRCRDVAYENGFNTVFLKRMEGNFCFTVKPSIGPGDALIGASPSLCRACNHYNVLLLRRSK